MKAREATLGQVYRTPEGQRVRVVSLLTNGVVVRYLATHNLRLLPNDFELESESAENPRQPAVTPEVKEVKEVKEVNEVQEVEEAKEEVEEQEVVPAGPIDLEAEKQDDKPQEVAEVEQTAEEPAEARVEEKAEEKQDASDEEVLQQVLSKTTSSKGVSTKDPQFLQMLLEGKGVSEIAKALGKEYRRVYNAVRMLKKSAEKKGKDFNDFLSERLREVVK